MPTLDEVDEVETVSTCRALRFYRSISPFAAAINVYNITLKIASQLAYTSVTYTFGSQRPFENKELEREGYIIGLLEVTSMVYCPMEIYASR